MLSILLSTCVIYNPQGEINDSTIKDFVYYTDLANKINFTAEKNDKLNNIDKLKEHFPELIFVNNTVSKEKMKDLIEITLYVRKPVNYLKKELIMIVLIIKN